MEFKERKKKEGKKREGKRERKKGRKERRKGKKRKKYGRGMVGYVAGGGRRWPADRGWPPWGQPKPKPRRVQV